MSAILDHFSYPPPHLNQWQQCVWYNLGAAQESLHQMRNRLSQGLPAVASPPRAELPLSSFKPATMLIRPSHGEKFIKASRDGGPTSSAATARTSLLRMTTSPKTEVKKKKKKRKSSKHTVTSETISPSEKKSKLISESLYSPAEGPFCDLDRTESALENSPHFLSALQLLSRGLPFCGPKASVTSNSHSSLFDTFLFKCKYLQ